MASSVVQICNLAIGHTGQSSFIAAINEAGSKAAVICNQFYEPCRDFVLADFPWSFASKTATLAEVETSRTNWSYAYALPVDCLTVRGVIVPGNRTPLALDRIPHKLGLSGDGARLLFCDVADAEIEYTAKVTNPNLFSPAFVLALSWYLSGHIATPLTGNPQLGNRGLQMYGTLISQAGAHDLNQQQDDAEPESSFISGRA